MGLLYLSKHVHQWQHMNVFIAKPPLLTNGITIDLAMLIVFCPALTADNYEKLMSMVFWTPSLTLHQKQMGAAS